MRVDPTNSEQAAAWDGGQGAYWALRAERFDAGVAAHHAELLGAAAIEATDSVLDIGCGSGRTTRDAARRASKGSAVGVDLSADQLAIARESAACEQLHNVSFVQADAQVYPFADSGFDVALSRHGVMFFGDAPAAFANIARALRPGGRLALLTWQPAACNGWMVAFRAALTGQPASPPPTAGPGPESLSDPTQVRELLAGAGFTDIALTGLNHPMYFGRDVADAQQFLTGQFAGTLAALEPTPRATAIDALHATLAEHLTTSGVVYDSATWLVQARKP